MMEKFYFYIRKLRAKLLDKLYEEKTRVQGRQSDSDHAGICRKELFAAFREVVKNPLNQRKDRACVPGRRRAPLVRVEKFFTELPFELPDVVCHGGRGNTEQIRALVNPAGFINRPKRFQQV